MNIFVYFLILNINGTLPAKPSPGTHCWKVTGWSQKVICTKTHGDAVEWLRQNDESARLEVEVSQ